VEEHTKKDHDVLIRIETNQLSIAEDVKSIKDRMAKFPCEVQKEKIKTLEKIVWGTMIASLCALIKTIFFVKL